MKARYIRFVLIISSIMTVFIFSITGVGKAIEISQDAGALAALEDIKPTPEPYNDAYRQYYRYGGGGTRVANPNDFITNEDNYIRPNAVAAAPVIDVWYGTEQHFGQLGTPQKWINILGNVMASGPVSLTYSLNGGLETELAVGPDVRRLVGSGDYNIELDKDDLLTAAPNQIVITATDNVNTLTTVETVSVTYDATTVWPLPYTIDWQTVSSLEDSVQVVDGLWNYDGNGVRLDPSAVGYDRIVAIGDMNWTDFEVTIPITVHTLDTSAYGNPFSVSPGIGLVPRWPGHSNNPPYAENGCSPGMHCGWLPAGGNPWYDFASNVADEGWFLSGGGTTMYDPLDRKMVLDTMYYWKLRLETVPEGTVYSFKVWQEGEVEPDWQMALQEYSAFYSDYSAQGSLLLVAHHVDATFGDIIFESVDSGGFSLDLATNGNGSITANPDQGSYSDGTLVTLTAVPASGWMFTGWSGDLTGNTNPAGLTMDANKAVTATFSEIGSGYLLSLDKIGSGTITVDPEQAIYSEGTAVTITATAATGWEFTGWSGDLTGSTNPTTLIMDANKSVSATFVVDTGVGLKSDDFDDNHLESFWTFYPGRTGDPTPEFSDSQIKLTALVGEAHDIWVDGITAPRIMQSVPDTDFEVEVKFDSSFNAGYQTQGIIVTQANGDALRFEFLYDGNSVSFFAASIIGNAAVPHHNVSIGANGAPMYMRLVREGDVWTHSYSQDGVSWTSFNFTQAFSVAQVGVYAGNDTLDNNPANAPAHTAVIDYFHTTSSNPVVNWDYSVFLPLVVE